MARQMTWALPPIADVEAITSPVERVRVICQHERRLGTLPTTWADLRARSVDEALEGGARKVVWLAREVGRTHSAISKIWKRARTLPVTAQPATQEATP